MELDTRSSLIDLAIGQVRRHGYSAFSYADLAEVAGLRKPSIHHHFPTKEDLGVAMVGTYTERFSAELERIDAGRATAIERLRGFARLYREGLGAEQGCLCGVLASEVAVLPLRVQDEVRQLFQMNLRWLERILNDGRAKRQLASSVEPRRDARTVLATLQGAMLVALSLQQPASFDHAVDGLLAGLSVARA